MESAHIAIVGSGICGLATALSLRKHCKGTITVYEASPELHEAGAGIQIPSNAARILDGLGVLKEIEKVAIEPEAKLIRAYKSGEVLSRIPVVPEMRNTFGYPNLMIHRAEYQRILGETAKARGIQLVFDAQVDDLYENAQAVTVTFHSGKCIDADLVIGADGIGIGSTVRRRILRNSNTDAAPTPHRLYRALISCAQMDSSPNLAALMHSSTLNCWIAPDRHIVAYPFNNSSTYNLAMVHAGPAATEQWNQRGNLDEMRQAYADFEPSVREMLGFVTDVRGWKISEVPYLERWRSAAGRVVLVGDAAHAMLPYLAQGGAQAVEDAVVLGECVGRCHKCDRLGDATRFYEFIRRPRAERVSKAARQRGEVMHMPDGETQKQRDIRSKENFETIRPLQGEVKIAVNGLPRAGSDDNPYSEITETDFQHWMLSFDAQVEARKFLDEHWT